MKIYNRSGEVIFETEDAYLLGTVVAAVKSSANLSSADLRFADLSFANLRSADLSSADLSFADLSFADLRFANLRSADLSSADLRFADLSFANLRYAVVAWSSHDFIAQLLLNEAGDNIERRKIAGLILVSRDWCWDQLFKIESPEREWALDVLRSQNEEGMPEMLKAHPKKAK